MCGCLLPRPGPLLSAVFGWVVMVPVVAAGPRRLQAELTREGGCPTISEALAFTRGPMEVEVRIDRGYDLPRIHNKSGAKADGYVDVLVQTGSDQFRFFTPAVKSEGNPAWDFGCWFPVAEQLTKLTIIGYVVDEDEDRHTPLGDVQLEVDLVQERYEKLELQNCTYCLAQPAFVSLHTKWRTQASGFNKDPEDNGVFAWKHLLGFVVVSCACGGAVALAIASNYRGVQGAPVSARRTAAALRATQLALRRTEAQVRLASAGVAGNNSFPSLASGCKEDAYP